MSLILVITNPAPDFVVLHQIQNITSGELASGARDGSTISNKSISYPRWAGVEDPKIMITTSRDPSSKLKQFAKVNQDFHNIEKENVFFNSTRLTFHEH